MGSDRTAGTTTRSVSGRSVDAGRLIDLGATARTGGLPQPTGIVA
jgi:hypothetical protein